MGRRKMLAQSIPGSSKPSALPLNGPVPIFGIRWTTHLATHLANRLVPRLAPHLASGLALDLAPGLLRGAALFGLLMLSGAGHGQTSSGAAGPAASRSEASKTDGKAAPRSPAPKVRPGGSGETPAERSARLKRECKGRPDAGACSGYTQ